MFGIQINLVIIHIARAYHRAGYFSSSTAIQHVKLLAGIRDAGCQHGNAENCALPVASVPDNDAVMIVWPRFSFPYTLRISMRLPTRYGLAACGALAVLSLVDRIREQRYDVPELALYLMGVLPNMAAAVAIPFVLLSIWAVGRPAATYRSARRAFSLFECVTGIGLIAWEFLQLSSHSLFFDPHDIAATISGLLLGALLFVLLTPNAGATAA